MPTNPNDFCEEPIEGQTFTGLMRRINALEVSAGVRDFVDGDISELWSMQMDGSGNIHVIYRNDSGFPLAVARFDGNFNLKCIWRPLDAAYGTVIDEKYRGFIIGSDDKAYKYSNADNELNVHDIETQASLTDHAIGAISPTNLDLDWAYTKGSGVVMLPFDNSAVNHGYKLQGATPSPTTITTNIGGAGGAPTPSGATVVLHKAGLISENDASFYLIADWSKDAAPGPYTSDMIAVHVYDSTGTWVSTDVFDGYVWDTHFGNSTTDKPIHGVVSGSSYYVWANDKQIKLSGGTVVSSSDTDVISDRGMVISGSNIYVIRAPGSNKGVYKYTTSEWGTGAAGTLMATKVPAPGVETEFNKYPTLTTSASLGTPDSGVSIPALDGLDNTPSVDEILYDLREAIEGVAGTKKNADTGNPFNWTDLSSDNLYFKALGDRTIYGATGGAAYDWTRDSTAIEAGGIFDIDIGELEDCVALLEASDNITVCA